MLAQLVEQLAFNQSVVGSTPTQPIMDTIHERVQGKTLSVTEYFFDRKKYIDRYVQGEHKWFGDVDSFELPTMVSNPRPWYLEQTTSREPTTV